MNSHHHTQGVKLIFFYLCKEITRVYKMHTIHISTLHCCILRDKCHKRVLLMGTFPADRSYRLFSVAYRTLFDLSLSRPGTMQR